MCYWAHILQNWSLYTSKPSCKVGALHSSWLLAYSLLRFERFGPLDHIRKPSSLKYGKINFLGLWCAIMLIFYRIQVFIYLNLPAKFEVCNLHGCGILPPVLLRGLDPQTMSQTQHPEILKKINFSGLWSATELIFCRIEVITHLNYPAKFDIWTLHGCWYTPSCLFWEFRTPAI
jgi:hypothetical protein